MFESLLVGQAKCSSDPDHEHRFREAGFVDIKVVKKALDVGNWRRGGTYKSELRRTNDSGSEIFAVTKCSGILFYQVGSGGCNEFF
jgi:hypothetical protein